MTTAAPAPEDVLEKVETLGSPGTPITTPEVAEGFDCTQRTIYNRLDSLVDDGVLQTKKVGANSRVWWYPCQDHDRVESVSDVETTRSTFRKLFENVPGLYLIIEPDDYEIVAVSDAYLEATMTDRADMLGKSLFEVFPADPEDPDPEGVPRLRSSLERVNAEREIDVMPVTYYPIPCPESVGRDFEDRWWSPTNSPVLSATGDIDYIIHRVEDVTPVVRQLEAYGEEELLERLDSSDSRRSTDVALHAQELHKVLADRVEELTELDRAKTTFFNNVSHEFRTPLTLILGPLGDALAEAEETLPPEQRERLKVANRSSQRLLKLVNTLLDFSRIEVGRAEASYEPTDLAEVTADLASNFRAAIERADMELNIDAPSLSEPVYVDRDMWEKIVLNLLSNAFKHTLEGEITVSVRAADGHVELEVHDTGTGIPEEELPNLFDRFHQVEGVRSRSHEGSGIGLALVQDLVDFHHGDIAVESTVGEGSTFTVRIPLGTTHLPEDRIEAEQTLDSTAVGAGPYVEEALRWLPAEDAAAEEESDAIADEGRDAMPDTVPRQAGIPEPDARVLVADDNTDMREYLERLLGRQWEVRAVPDGAAALAAAQESTPDLVLADVMMPELDGFELLEALRDDPETREIPVIMLSAKASEESRIEGLETGADDYMVKPFSANELMARVGSTLELAAVREEAEQALRESEERFRTLFDSISESMAEAFCVIEVFSDEERAASDGLAGGSADAAAEPTDYRFVETNAAFEALTGLTDVVGERRSELELAADPPGFDVYDDVLRTGASKRVETNGHVHYDGWYDARVFPYGGADSGKIAFLIDDITERKEAEQKLRENEAALKQLNDATRELIDTDMATIADRVAPLVREVLDVEYAALWRYDDWSGDLGEHAVDTAPDVVSEAVDFPTEFSDLVWETFIRTDVNVENDLDDRPDGSSTLRSCTFVPLGRHGVVCLGSSQSVFFDEQIVNLIQTVAATIKTAWDRADGERELERQNKELTRLDRLNSLIRGIDRALVEADTMDGIDEAVCERLADSAIFEFAWIGEFDADADVVRPRVWTNIDSIALEKLLAERENVGPTRDEGPFSTAIRTQELQVVADIATDARAAPWREAALERGARSCLSIPLTYCGSVYGVLVVYGSTPQRDEHDIEVLAELGDTIAHALNAVETRETLRTDSVVELTLRTTGATTPLCRLARQLGCPIEFEGLVPDPGDDVTVFFTVSDVPAADVLSVGEASFAFDTVTCLVDSEGDALFRACVIEPTLASLFLEDNVVVRSLTIDPTATAVVDVFRADQVREFLDRLRGSMPNLELLARHTKSRPLETRQTFRQTFDDRLTSRQQEVLHTAYRSGFFQSPRVQTGKELATTLDISTATFTYHLREAERKLCELVFDST